MKLRKIVIFLLYLWINPSLTARFYCEYYQDPDYGFGCELSYINLTPEHKTDEISFSGTVDQKKQVQLIHVRESTVSYLPPQIMTFFPNMVNLAIWDSKLDLQNGELFENFTHLKKLSLSRNNIQSIDENSLGLLENLELVGFQNNKIELLKGEIFKNNRKLTYIGFKNNKIYMIDPTIFDPLEHLEVVDFRNNICIDENFFITRGQLSSLRSSLRKCFENYYLTQHIAESQKKELLKINTYLEMLNEKLDKLTRNNKNETTETSTINPAIEIEQMPHIYIPPIPPVTSKYVEEDHDGDSTDTDPDVIDAVDSPNEDDFDFYEITTQKPTLVTPKLQLTLPQEIPQFKSQFHDRIISKFDDILSSSQNRMKTLNERKFLQTFNTKTTTPETSDNEYYDYEE